MPESSPFLIWLPRQTVTPRAGDFALGQATPLAHVGEPVGADLEDEPGRAALNVLATDRLNVLVADVRPAHGAHFGGSFFQVDLIELFRVRHGAAVSA
jgi:hypothetical protein